MQYELEKERKEKQVLIDMVAEKLHKKKESLRCRRELLKKTDEVQTNLFTSLLGVEVTKIANFQLKTVGTSSKKASNIFSPQKLALNSSIMKTPKRQF